VRSLLLYPVLLLLLLPVHSLGQHRTGSNLAPADYSMAFQTERRSAKSVVLAAALSLILPGMGELYAGSFESGKYAFFIDGGLWLSYAGMNAYGDWLRTDARAFAERHSGADLSEKDERFEVNIGNFLDTDSYNATRLRNREFDLLYAHESFAWQWDSDANRQRFKDLRIQSDQVYQNGKFIIAALVVNRIVSAFAAGRAASAYNRRGISRFEWGVNAGIQGGVMKPHGVELSFTTSF
jgi:hypothetical protein